MLRIISSITFLCFLVSVQVQAQFGVKAGVNFTAVGSYGNSEEGESADLKLGPLFGLVYKASLSEKVDLMVELNFEGYGTISKKEYTIALPVQDPMTGTVLGIGDYVIDQEIDSRQNYINIPILFAFGQNKFKWYIGPNIRYLLSGSGDIDRTIDINLGGMKVGELNTFEEGLDWFDYESFQSVFVTVPPEDGDFLNRLDVGINLGAMYNFSDNFFADVRVNQGLLDVSNNNYDFSIYPNESFLFPSREDTDRSLSIQLSVGYMF
ncbi:MAG: outer membrane beta-barrel protein [Bacteroidota bacterium]